ncbi:hypothetical protein PHET_02639 [Paragonimus heterotremus]|uniref:Uncharacterized protein n=1 Tax=Paragonimus heterotremus TaxID=100268 RepID=A0A8J4SRU1_9TREM|nr:hypothetical protein PHET_02639 [Paragonimus heterotremus]
MAKIVEHGAVHCAFCIMRDMKSNILTVLWQGFRQRDILCDTHESNKQASSKLFNPARDYLDSNQWKWRKRYREAILSSYVLKLNNNTKRHLSKWIARQLALIGQCVDTSIFDLRMKPNELDEFFQPYLADAYTKLIPLIDLLLDYSADAQMSENTLIWILCHWFYVCRMHLLRGWLLRVPIRRQFYGVPSEIYGLEELLNKYQSEALRFRSCPVLRAWFKNGACILNDLVTMKVCQTCHPLLARSIYENLWNQFSGQHGQTKRPLWKTTVRFKHQQVVLMEAQSRAASRLLINFESYMANVLHRKRLDSDFGPTAPELYDAAQLWSAVYDYPLERYFALAGLLSVSCIIILLLLLFALLQHLAPKSRYFSSIISSQENQETSLRRVIGFYCFLAPLCVYLNLELRLLWAHMLINKHSRLFPHRTSHRLLFTQEDRANPQQLFNIGFQINLTWRAFENQERRVKNLFIELGTELTRRGIFLPTDLF